MPEVLEAKEAYTQAEADARLLRARARARLGRAIDEANTREQDRASLEGIAREMKVALNQVIRYRDTYRNWDRDHPGVPLDAD